jgi:16S rRNA (cytosine967-C5)-methyltransferase
MASRAAALKLLDAVLRRGLPLEGALDRATQALDRSEDKAFAHAIVAETLRRLPDLDALIDGATAKPLPDDAKARFALRIALVQALALGTPPHAAIATVLPLVDGGPRRLVHGVYGTLLRKNVRLPEIPTEPLASSWEAAWGETVVDEAAKAIAAPPPLDITLRDPSETAAWAERLGGVSLAPGHVRLPAGARITMLEGFDAGAWWVQDLAASLPARLLGQGAGQKVLDLCAAPGGKTMQLAANGWGVTAVDNVAQRLNRLRDNLKRTGLTAKAAIGDALTFSPDVLFDAVLLDAPCSATGIFRRHPEVLHRVTPRSVTRLAEQQAAMLARAAQAVKPGGRLVYATCSLQPEEGEHIARAFAAGHSSFAADPVTAAELPEGIAPDPEGWVRVLPGMLAPAGGCDGFFVARFTRSA